MADLKRHVAFADDMSAVDENEEKDGFGKVEQAVVEINNVKEIYVWEEKMRKWHEQSKNYNKHISSLLEELDRKERQLASWEKDLLTRSLKADAEDQTKTRMKSFKLKAASTVPHGIEHLPEAAEEEKDSGLEITRPSNITNQVDINKFKTGLSVFSEELVYFVQKLSLDIASNEDAKGQENQVLNLLEKAQELSLQARTLSRRWKNRDAQEPYCHLEKQHTALTLVHEALKTYFRSFVTSTDPSAIIRLRRSVAELCQSLEANQVLLAEPEPREFDAMAPVETLPEWPQADVVSSCSSLSRESSQLQDVLNDLVREFACIVDLAIPMLAEKTGEALSSEERFLRRDGLVRHLQRSRDILLAHAPSCLPSDIPELSPHSDREFYEPQGFSEGCKSLLAQLKLPETIKNAVQS